MENKDDLYETKGLRGILKIAFLRLVRFYTFNTPISKGKYRFYQTALNMLKAKPQALRTQIRDGRTFVADLTTGMEETVFFIGEYEKSISEITSEMIAAGDTCIDVGANFGWYTTLMSMRSGKDGATHSFEPVPRTYIGLSRNCKLLTYPQNVHVNNLALGDTKGRVVVNQFDDLPTGHASIATKDGSHMSSFECSMVTLDSYLEENNVADVAFVKVDIEGSEMMFLKGADRLFKQTVPPVFLMEMALQQTSFFGYIPDDLIRYIGEQAEYLFYKVEEGPGHLIRIDGFEKDDIGANVFCVPASAKEEIHMVVQKYLAV